MMESLKTRPHDVQEETNTSAIYEGNFGRLLEASATRISDQLINDVCDRRCSPSDGLLSVAAAEEGNIGPSIMISSPDLAVDSTISLLRRDDGDILNSSTVETHSSSRLENVQARTDIDKSGCGQTGSRPTGSAGGQSSQDEIILPEILSSDTQVCRMDVDLSKNDLTEISRAGGPSQKSTCMDEPSLKCPECDLIFANDISLKAHRLTHSADSQFVCGICGKGFGSESLLSSHFATHSESRRYTCPNCGRVFRTLLSFQQHEKLHKVGRMFTCKRCGKAFRRKSILQKHRYSHMKKVRIEYACEHCSECFATVLQLQQHERKMHCRRGKAAQERLYCCEECTESFSSEDQLRKHRQLHATQRGSFCQDCGRDYSSQEALQNHRCFRVRRALFTCKDCGRGFAKKQDALDHEKTHHEVEIEYDCEICFETFSSKAELREHSAVHRNTQSFKCRHCGKQFKKRGFLTNHLKTHANHHSKRKSNSSHPGTVNNHVKEDGKPDLGHESVFIKEEGIYRCQDCGKTFKQKGQTIYHQRKASNVRAFPCTKCSNSYLTSAHLKAHMLTHSAVKALKCDGCGKEFNYKSNLTSHQKTCPQIASIQGADRKYSRRCAKQAKAGTVDGRDGGSSVESGDEEQETEGSEQGQGCHQSVYNKEIGLYQCKDCGQTFKQKGQTLYHQKKVSNQRQFVCKVCKKAFLTSPHLKAHELVHAVEKPLTCQGCGKGFNYKCNLKTHQRNGCLGMDPEGKLALSNMKLHKCEECGKEFKLKMYYEKHRKMHQRKNQEQNVTMEGLVDTDNMGQRKEHRSDYNEEEGTYKCRDCHLVFKQSGQALYHFRKYSNERNFVCKVCPKSFLTSAHLKSHIMSHTKEKPFKCWYCGKGFNHNSNRKYHQRTSCSQRPPQVEQMEEDAQQENSRGRGEAKKPITCVVCNKQFMLTHSWKVHMRVHTREQPFLCEYCGKSFRCRSNLYVHRNSHTKERPYLCNYCGKNFAQLSHVRVHEAIHNTEKPYKCGICGKSFNQEFYLKRHKVMHTDDRPFVCFCGKSFKYRGSLVSHKATHSTKRPYACHLCSKAFKQSCHLKVHILTHGELKPFKCDKCQKAFIRKNQLSRHQRSHSDERCYLCNICGKDFKHSSSMKRHQERKHNKEHSETANPTSTTVATTMATTDPQPLFDSVPYAQPQTNGKKNLFRGNKSKTPWPTAVDGVDIEEETPMHMTAQLEARAQPNQQVDNRVLAQMDNRLTGQPVECRMANQPIDYRVSPQLTDPRMPSQSVSSHLSHLASGHPVYSEAQYIQGQEFASVHLPHIGTFDFRTSTSGSVDYTIL
ncbi:zinc finger protein 91-like [Acanthaster planci]|uniref:Zinc finger protein 865 n=1 Tax=Acanthaster planci TaxID=133434 RepID=A0A8B7ZK19_ACAPL|nr:zinc finger protein 91-like [Acanthaster planci]